ncbi:glyoxalase-like protein [Salana multivorans]|uniref:Glyoxalase-like protein n=1 Tax=Salana multivorans TaxID=120377 RepID=A0A3N2D0A9_9MICO|nr:VOC family protein [Salana multivorans]ROR93217.1 glyoxalase-like protein [Salana multivorans]
MSQFPSTLDHVVLAGPDLAEAVDHVERLTGVRGAPGGQHPTGTANHLVAFTVDGQRVPHYLEIIGPDPARGVAASEVATFGIAGLTGPGVRTFAIHPDDIDATAAAAAAAGIVLGEVQPLSRRTPAGDLLEWRITSGPNRTPERVIPFLIDWGTTPHPGLADLPTLELVELRVTHPDPAAIEAAYGVLGVDLAVAAGDEPTLTLVVESADGRRVELG